MHLHFERVDKPTSYCDCNMTSLSWMGKVPDVSKEDGSHEGWKLNRNQYYNEGWLAAGNIRGVVGVTYTSVTASSSGPSSSTSSSDSHPPRTNFNLRGHRTEVTLVRWNEPYQKLATCDSSGIIFVWIKYEGRWSIELINDRSTPVTDFAWSHDGRMALICYTDGFVLVGSVTGQRYWSSMLNLDSCHTTCGIWTPDDQHVLFGTSNGHIVVIQVTGTIVTQVPVRDGVSIQSMMWSCERFKMEDGSSEDSSHRQHNHHYRNNHQFRMGGSTTTGTSGSGGVNRPPEDHHSAQNTTNQHQHTNHYHHHHHNYTLAVCFVDGVIFLMKSYDDLFPIVISTSLLSPKMEWSNGGDILAVAGHIVKITGSHQYATTYNRGQSPPGYSSTSVNYRQNIPPSTSQCSSSTTFSSSPSLLSALKVFPDTMTSNRFEEITEDSSKSITTRRLYHNTIKFYTDSGSIRYQVSVNFLLHPITALTWGHADKRIYVATGPVLHIAWVGKKVPSLQLLSRLSVYRMMENEQSVRRLPLPTRLQSFIGNLFSRTLRCSLPNLKNLRDFVSKPPPQGIRLYCTLIRHDDELTGSTTYVLYLEYLGGLVPILKGKRASKLKPEFVIFDPQVEDGRNACFTNKFEKEEHEFGSSSTPKTQSLPSSPVHSAKVLFSSLLIPSRMSTSKPCTPILGRRQRQPQIPSSSRTNQHSTRPSPRHSMYYWSSGSESEGDIDEDMTDGYGHVYSLPSPIMRRKCRRKRRFERENREHRSHNNTTDNDSDGDSSSFYHSTLRLRRRLERRYRHNDNQNNRNQNGIEVPQQEQQQETTTTRRPDILKPESTYLDEMPETERLILVTSNIWGTRFKILGLIPWLPSTLGSIYYRTSVLHLQPRQMTLSIKELGSVHKVRRRSRTGKKNSIISSPSKVSSSRRRDQQYSAHSSHSGNLPLITTPTTALSSSDNIKSERISLSDHHTPFTTCNIHSQSSSTSTTIQQLEMTPSSYQPDDDDDQELTLTPNSFALVAPMTPVKRRLGGARGEIYRRPIYQHSSDSAMSPSFNPRLSAVCCRLPTLQSPSISAPSACPPTSLDVRSQNVGHSSYVPPTPLPLSSGKEHEDNSIPPSPPSPAPCFPYSSDEELMLTLQINRHPLTHQVETVEVLEGCRQHPDNFPFHHDIRDRGETGEESNYQPSLNQLSRSFILTSMTGSSGDSGIENSTSSGCVGGGSSADSTLITSDIVTSDGSKSVSPGDVSQSIQRTHQPDLSACSCSYQVDCSQFYLSKMGDSLGRDISHASEERGHVPNDETQQEQESYLSTTNVTPPDVPSATASSYQERDSSSSIFRVTLHRDRRGRPLSSNSRPGVRSLGRSILNSPLMLRKVLKQK